MKKYYVIITYLNNSFEEEYVIKSYGDKATAERIVDIIRNKSLDFLPDVQKNGFVRVEVARTCYIPLEVKFDV